MKTVLIADDHVEILEIIETLLTAGGDELRIRTALDGREAIHHLETEPIDLVVTDLTMPVVDGFQVLAHVMRNLPSVPVIVMTAYGSATTRRRLSELGPLIYIEKPFNPTELIDRIRGVLSESARGHLEGVTLASFLQLLRLEKKTCLVRVTSGEREGRLKLASGELVDAEHAETRGRDAAFEILGWEDVEIRLESILRPNERTIDAPLELVLLEAAERRDEQRGAAEPAEIAVESEDPGREPIELTVSRLAMAFTSRSGGIESLLRCIVEATEWDAAVLWRWMPAENRLRAEGFWYAPHVSGGPFFEELPEIDPAADEPAARAWRERRANISPAPPSAVRAGFVSAAAFPILSDDDRSIGFVELLGTRIHRPQTDDPGRLDALGASLGGLLDHARNDAIRAAVVRRERDALDRASARETRQAFLARAGAILSCSLDESVLWNTFERLVVPQLAEWCILDVFEPGGELRRAAVFHPDPERLEWTEELRLRGVRSSDGWPALGRVLHSRTPEIWSAPTFGRDAELLARLGFQCALTVPLDARDRLLGAATLVSSGNRDFDEEDLDTARDLAHRAALAVDNARRARANDSPAGEVPRQRSIAG